MARKATVIQGETKPVEVETVQRPCPWIRATEILLRAQARLEQSQQQTITAVYNGMTYDNASAAPAAA